MAESASHTLQGLGSLAAALVLDALIVSATLAVSLALLPDVLLTMAAGGNPMPLATPPMIGYVGLTVFGGVGLLILGFAGFWDVWDGRREFGRLHERRIRRARIEVVLAGASLAAFGLLPRSPPSILGTPDELVCTPAWALGPRIVLTALIALFVGLALTDGLGGLVTREQIHRLRVGTGLGVVSALSGSLMGLPGILCPAVDVWVHALMGSALAGEGVAILSLYLFIHVYREVRRDLTARRPSPVAVSAAAA